MNCLIAILCLSYICDTGSIFNVVMSPRPCYLVYDIYRTLNITQRPVIRRVTHVEQKLFTTWSTQVRTEFWWAHFPIFSSMYLLTLIIVCLCFIRGTLNDLFFCIQKPLGIHYIRTTFSSLRPTMLKSSCSNGFNQEYRLVSIISDVILFWLFKSVPTHCYHKLTDGFFILIFPIKSRCRQSWKHLKL